MATIEFNELFKNINIVLLDFSKNINIVLLDCSENEIKLLSSQIENSANMRIFYWPNERIPFIPNFVNTKLL
jgi:hypothetical protein